MLSKTKSCLRGGWQFGFGLWLAGVVEGWRCGSRWFKKEGRALVGGTCCWMNGGGKFIPQGQLALSGEDPHSPKLTEKDT